MWRAAQGLLLPLFETPHGGRKQIPAIEGLRALATLLVFLVHYVSQIRPWLAADTATQWMSENLAAVGHSGVDLFFILSGFLIYGGLIETPVPFGRYLRRRLKRIYPTFTAVFMLYVAASWMVPSKSKLPAGPIDMAIYLVANFLLLPGMFPIRPMITVAWSLSYEMFLYLACPLLIIGLRLWWWPKRARVGLYLFLAVSVIAASPWIGSKTRLAMFLAGMILVDTFRSVGWRWLTLVALVAVTTGLSVAANGTHLERLAPACWTIGTWIAFFPLCYAAFQDDIRLAQALSWTPLRWFGNMSYSFFLLHGLALNCLFYFLEWAAPPAGQWDAMFWMLLPIAFVVALLPSAVLFLIIEKPLSLSPVAGMSKPS